MVHDVQLLIQVAFIDNSSVEKKCWSYDERRKKCRNMYYLAINNNNKVLQLL